MPENTCAYGVEEKNTTFVKTVTANAATGVKDAGYFTLKGVNIRCSKGQGHCDVNKQKDCALYELKPNEEKPVGP